MTGSQTPSDALARWRAQRTKDIALPGGVTLRVRVVDVLSLLDGDDSAPNPLLALAQQAAFGKKKEDSGEDTGASVLRELGALNALRGALNGMLRRVAVAIVLEDGAEIPQPFTHDVSADDFTIEEKMIVFQAMLGGEQFAAAASFREEPVSPVVAAPDGESVWSEAVEPAGDPG